MSLFPRVGFYSLSYLTWVILAWGFFRHSNTGCNTHPLLIRMELSDWSAPTRPTEDNFSTAHFGQQNFTLERKRTCLNSQLYFCTSFKIRVDLAQCKYKLKNMIWNCVEERVTIERDNGAQYGRMVRKGFESMFWNSPSVPVVSKSVRCKNSDTKIIIIFDYSPFSTLVRKIIFGDIFADKMAVLSRNPIPNAAHRHLNVSKNEINKRQFHVKV